jgi:hypothetical protein
MGRNLIINWIRNDIEARRAAGEGGEESVEDAGRLANPGLPLFIVLRVFTLFVGPSVTGVLAAGLPGPRVTAAICCSI